MLGKVTVSLLTTASLVACMDVSDDEQEDSTLSSVEQESCTHDPHDELAKLKKHHDKYRDINRALADGYELGVIFNGPRVVTGCVSHPTLGAMGYHYFKQKRFDNPQIHEQKPEALVYHEGANGELVLGAVEWVVWKDAWEAKHGIGAPAPEVHGHPMMILNPTLNWYVAHAWLWTPNPSGVLSDWNPDVTCL